MDLNEIEYFLALSKQGSFSKAADELFISQSALSQFLQKLEGKLDVQLFIRERKGLTLTLAGKMYLEAAYKIHGIKAKLLNDLEATKRLDNLTIRIGVAGVRSISFVSILTEHLYNAYPNAIIELKKGTVSVLLKNLHEKTVDFAFMAMPNDTGGLLSVEMCAEELLVALSPLEEIGHIIPSLPPNGSVIDIHIIKNLKFILYASPTVLRQVSDKYFSKIGFIPQIFSSVYDFSDAYEILQHYPVAYITSAGFTNRLSECPTFRLKGNPLYRLGVVYRQEVTNNTVARFFLELAKKYKDSF